MDLAFESTAGTPALWHSKHQSPQDIADTQQQTSTLEL